MTTLRIGSALADITPDWSLSLAGFAARTEPSRGVSHPIKVRVSVLESVDDHGAASRAVVAVADVLWWGPQQVKPLRQELAAITGAPESHILLSATHTHSGPQTSYRAATGVGIADPAFVTLLEQRTLEAASEAVARLEPVTVSRFTGTHDLGFNRRNDINPDGAEDPALTVLRFDRADGSPATLWVHYACHPVITEEPFVSSEFCGVAMDRLETDLGATALYLQGCCGTINPRIGESKVTTRGTNADVERIGNAFAGAVTSLMKSAATPLQPIAITGRIESIDLPFAPLPTEPEIRAQTGRDDVHGELARALLAHPEWLTPSIPLDMQRIDLADGLSLLAMNGEIVAEFGLAIRETSQDTVLPMGYANGMTGYVPTAAIIAEGGYEAGGAGPYFFLPTSFDPSVETVVRAAIDRIATP